METSAVYNSLLSRHILLLLWIDNILDSVLDCNCITDIHLIC
jgi:hypothetical protein